MKKIILGGLLLVCCGLVVAQWNPGPNNPVSGNFNNPITVGGNAMTFPASPANIARTDIGQTFNGNQAINNGASDSGLTLITSAGAGFINFQPQNTHFNWRIACQYNINNGCEITPSTIVGGGTYSTPIFSIVTTGTSVTGTMGISGSVTMPGLASSSAATTGTVCWTTATGNLTVDTTLACLASTLKVKKNVASLDIGLDAVLHMRPVSYDLKPEFNPEHLGHQVGLIAEEVGKIDQRLIAVDDNGEPRGVRYMQLTAVLVKAIQDQQKQIRALQRAILKKEK